jgi:hypothetical protein
MMQEIKNQIEIRNNLNLDECRTKRAPTNDKKWIVSFGETF